MDHTDYRYEFTTPNAQDTCLEFSTADYLPRQTHKTREDTVLQACASYELRLERRARPGGTKAHAPWGPALLRGTAILVLE